MAATGLKIKIFKKGLCTALDISNICHLAKNLSFLTTWCPEKLAQNFRKVIFWPRFPIQMPENARVGAIFDTSVLGSRLIFFDSVKSSRSPIIQTLKYIQIKKI